MPTWNAPTLAATALVAFYVFNGVRGVLGDNSVVPGAEKPVSLLFVQCIGYHMLMDACLIIGVVANDIAHVMMPAFVASMVVTVYSHFLMDDPRGSAPALAFGLVFAWLARGAPARNPMKWNVCDGRLHPAGSSCNRGWYRDAVRRHLHHSRAD